MDKLASDIKNALYEQGFTEVGITKAEFMPEEADYFENWLKEGNAAGMSYLFKNSEKRYDPSKLLQGAKTVIVALMPFPAGFQQKSRFHISKYALLNDYHYVIKSRLQNVVAKFPKIAMQAQQCFCDSAPLLERSLAYRAGLGLFGKNSMLINPKLGSCFFIGEILCPLDLPCDKPMDGQICGNCNLCIESCPTGALSKAHKGMNACKCLSYITIEDKDNVTKYPLVKTNSVLFGCDKCLEVCPHNKKAVKLQKDSLFQSFTLQPYAFWSDEQWLSMDKPTYNASVKNSPLGRAGYKKLRSCIDYISSSPQE